VESMTRVRCMVEAMDGEGFGSCSNHYECQAVCPKGIHVKNIARMNREYFKSLFKSAK
jgi:succinate dehydrogenase / fumarate reductase iron-sulfur subunit